ncbi:hypothetical protein Tco_0347528 [Tanacetum coccineum]
MSARDLTRVIQDSTSTPERNEVSAFMPSSSILLRRFIETKFSFSATFFSHCFKVALSCCSLDLKTLAGLEKTREISWLKNTKERRRRFDAIITGGLTPPETKKKEPQPPQVRTHREGSNKRRKKGAAIKQSVQRSGIIKDTEREVVDQKVALHEEDVGYKETTKDSQWYLDNGASNHMMGMRDHFENLDEKVSGRVKFGDGSYIEIQYEKVQLLIECR